MSLVTGEHLADSNSKSKGEGKISGLNLMAQI